jgi:hypothetical protein
MFSIKVFNESRIFSYVKTVVENIDAEKSSLVLTSFLIF